MNLRFPMRTMAVAIALGLSGGLAVTFVTPAAAQISIGVSINVAPPELPVYEQPALPAPGYIWTPGYWAWSDAGYYWVPGVWVEPPTVGVLWTPGYWGYDNAVYGWHEGYWGPHVGFYGGVNYGYGYGGVGFFGGEWRNGAFAYNQAAANFGSVHVTNVYNNVTVINQNTIVNNSHTSFNGAGGIAAQPTPEQRQFMNEPHTAPTTNQVALQKSASQDRAQLASVNNGRPATLATANHQAYIATATEHAKAQPITPADRTAAAQAQKAPPAAREANGAEHAPAPGAPAAHPPGVTPSPAENHAATPVAHPPVTAPRPTPEPARPATSEIAHPPTPAARPAPEIARPAADETRPAAPRPAQPTPMARPAPIERPATPPAAAAEHAAPRPAAPPPEVHAPAPRPAPAAHEERKEDEKK